MVNKPKFFKAWQAMTQAYNVMLDSNYIARLYAYNALEYFFNNEDDVKEFVIPTLTPEDQEKVYTDTNYGMNSLDGLTQWMSTQDETTPSESAKAAEIVKYFKTTKNVSISSDQLKTILDVGSMINMVHAQVSRNLLNDPKLEQHTSVDLASTIP